MNVPARGLTRIVALLAALSLLPSGSAADVFSGSADEMIHEGTLHVDGDLWVLRLAEANTTQAPSIQLTASSGYGYYYEIQSIVANSETVLPSERAPVGSKSNPLEGFSVTSFGSRETFDIRVIPHEGATFRSTLRGATGLSALPNVGLDAKGDFSAVDEFDVHTEPDEDHQELSTVIVDHPSIVTEARGGSGDVVVRGNFVLELLGAHVLVDSDDTEPTPYHTGRYDKPLLPTGAGLGETRFLRLILENATLTLQHAGTSDRVLQWASTETALESAGGRVQFQDPTGSLLDLIGASESREFPTGFAASLTPDADGRFSVELRDGPGLAPTASAWTNPAGFNPIPIALALGAVAVVAMVVRRGRPAPPLSHMEAALEEGAFDRAVRLASHILRRDPGQESARLGRAIALSRSGRQEQVVKDLESYLSDNEPSDGTMHYVLGLAYRDLGREALAHSALTEAVRRTPALARQVSGSAPPPNAIDNDAQGYT